MYAKWESSRVVNVFFSSSACHSEGQRIRVTKPVQNFEPKRGTHYFPDLIINVSEICYLQSITVRRYLSCRILSPFFECFFRRTASNPHQRPKEKDDVRLSATDAQLIFLQRPRSHHERNFAQFQGLWLLRRVYCGARAAISDGAKRYTSVRKMTFFSTRVHSPRTQ